MSSSKNKGSKGSFCPPVIKRSRYNQKIYDGEYQRSRLRRDLLIHPTLTTLATPNATTVPMLLIKTCRTKLVRVVVYKK